MRFVVTAIRKADSFSGGANMLQQIHVDLPGFIIEEYSVEGQVLGGAAGIRFQQRLAAAYDTAYAVEFIDLK